MMKFMTHTMPDTAKAEMINARLPIGSGERMDRVLYGGELRSAFIRHAIEAELRRREADLSKKANR